MAKGKGGVNKNSEVLQGTLDLMILKRYRRWVPCTDSGSRAGWSS